MRYRRTEGFSKGIGRSYTVTKTKWNRLSLRSETRVPVVLCSQGTGTAFTTLGRKRLTRNNEIQHCTPENATSSSPSLITDTHCCRCQQHTALREVPGIASHCCIHTADRSRGVWNGAPWRAVVEA